MSDDDKKYLPQINLRFRSHPSFPKSNKMPIVEVVLPAFPQPILALVDSGATGSILHESVASVIGLTPGRNEVYCFGAGVSGGYKYWKAKPIKVGINGYEFLYQFDVPVENAGMAWGCILGHNTLFRHAKIEFKSFREEFSIKFRKDIN